MRLLAIETSCDETSTSVVEGDVEQGVKILSNVVASSMKLHSLTGGIIPEVAARNQIEYVIPVISEALEIAGVRFDRDNPPEIDMIALTYGPGLIGSLLVGVETVKTLSFTWNKPIIPVNHLFGHIYANWLMADRLSVPDLPAVALVVSGGHTDLVLMNSHEDIKWLGGTRDDAAGEAFDKCARLLGYPYPGGPKVSELAQKGNPKTFNLPKPMIGTHDFDFSFSGLKTAFINETKKHFSILRNSSEKIGWQEIALIEKLNESQKQILYDLCASLQDSITEVLVRKTLDAIDKFGVSTVLLGGGVAANQMLRDKFTKHEEINLFVPPKSLCVDNAAMIGAAAFFQNKIKPWRKITANPELYFD